jgi:hypothetical protein
MIANEVAVHEVDGRRMRPVPDRLSPFPSVAYRRAAALLSLYRSRVDFLEDLESENGAECPRRRSNAGSVLIGHDPSAAH